MNLKITNRIPDRTKIEIFLITLSIVFGILNTYLLVGWSVINPLNLDWLTSDSATHYLGWAFLRQESVWSFPPTWAENLGYPLGISVSYLDSIPLVAVLLKPFSQLLPEEFQYLGLYLIFSSILQIYFGLKLCRIVCKGDLFFNILGASILLISPIFTARFTGHTALTSHWLILASLYYYFLNSKTVTQKIIPSLIILILAGGVHPYLALMCLLITFATCLSLKLYKQVTFKGAIGLAIVAIVTLAVSFILFGFLLIGDTGEYHSGVYGFYSMNLLAPLDPQNLGLFIKDLPHATEGQYEGYNYLGLGVILLLFFVIARYPQEIFKLKTRKIIPLLVLFLISLALAVSSKITIGSIVIINIGLPDQIVKLLSIFRSSGRLFWPGFYLLTIAAIVMVFKNFSPRHRKILLFLALIVQLFDLNFFRSLIRTQYQAKFSSPLKSEQWQALEKEHKHLVVIPAWQCEPEKTPGGRDAFWIFGRLAAQQKLTINSLYAARISKENINYYCQEMPSQLQKGKLDRSTAYIFSDRFVKSLLQNKIESHYCQKLDGFNLCRVSDRLSGFTEEIIDSGIANYRLGTEMSFRRANGISDALKYQAFGWSSPENAGTWTNGKEASLVLKIDSIPSKNLELIGDVIPFVSDQHYQQHIDIFVNQIFVGSWTFRYGEIDQLPKVLIPKEIVSEKQIFKITFRLKDAKSPAELNINPDTRLLGIFVKKIRIDSHD